MKALADLHVKLFADGADKAGMLEMYHNPLIQGFTTNPTLMRKADILDYQAFALDIVRAIPDRPISFEVFSDDFGDMAHQARTIAQWGENVYVKIPVTNTWGESSVDLVRTLAQAGVKLNVTALMTLDQVQHVSAALADGPPAFVSVFAGRIADTGRDPSAAHGGGGGTPAYVLPMSNSSGPAHANCSISFRPTASAAILLRRRTISWRNYGWWAKTCTSTRSRPSKCFVMTRSKRAIRSSSARQGP